MIKVLFELLNSPFSHPLPFTPPSLYLPPLLPPPFPSFPLLSPPSPSFPLLSPPFPSFPGSTRKCCSLQKTFSLRPSPPETAGRRLSGCASLYQDWWGNLHWQRTILLTQVNSHHELLTTPVSGPIAFMGCPLEQNCNVLSQAKASRKKLPEVWNQ